MQWRCPFLEVDSIWQQESWTVQQVIKKKGKLDKIGTCLLDPTTHLAVVNGIHGDLFFLKVTEEGMHETHCLSFAKNV